MDHVAAKTNWRDSSHILIIQDVKGQQRARVYRAHAPPQEVCDNIVCTLKLTASMHLDDQQALVQTVYDGLQEDSRKKVSDELRRFIAVDNVAVKVRVVKNVARPSSLKPIQAHTSVKQRRKNVESGGSGHPEDLHGRVTHHR